DDDRARVESEAPLAEERELGLRVVALHARVQDLPPTVRALSQLALEHGWERVLGGQALPRRRRVAEPQDALHGRGRLAGGPRAWGSRGASRRRRVGARTADAGRRSQRTPAADTRSRGREDCTHG